MSVLTENLLTIGGLIGTGLQAVAQLRQGRIEQGTFEFNAAVQTQKAQLIKEKAKLDIERQRKRARRFIASQEAAFAAAGVRLTGSPLEVIADSEAELLLDIAITDFNARVDVLNVLTEARFQLFKAQQARNTGFIRAGATLLKTLPSFNKLRFRRPTPRAEEQVFIPPPAPTIPPILGAVP